MSEQDPGQLPTIATTNEGFVGISFPTSELLTSLANYALSSGINTLNKSNSFEPLVIRVLDNDEMSLHKYSNKTGANEAVKSIDSLPNNVKAYALVLTIAYKQEHDAIFIEIGERGQEEGYQFVQKYKPKGFLSTFARIDLPIFLGKIPQKLK